MRTSISIPLAAGMILMACAAVRAGEPCVHRLGFGAHYWKTLDQLKDEHRSIDDSGLSWLASYQYAPSWLKLEGDLEIFPKGYYGSTETTYAPQALVLLGSWVYAGAGVGVVYADDLRHRLSGALYLLRAGLDLEVLPRLHLDLNANYYFADWDDWSSFNTDTITLGGQVRVAF